MAFNDLSLFPLNRSNKHGGCCVKIFEGIFIFISGSVRRLQLRCLNILAPSSAWTIIPDLEIQTPSEKHQPQDIIIIFKYYWYCQGRSSSCWKLSSLHSSFSTRVVFVKDEWKIKPTNCLIDDCWNWRWKEGKWADSSPASSSFFIIFPAGCQENSRRKICFVYRKWKKGLSV